MNDIQIAIEIGAQIAAKITKKLDEYVIIQPTMTLDEVAEELKMSEEKVRQLCNTGKLPYIKLDRQYRIKPKDVNDYMDRCYYNPGN